MLHINKSPYGWRNNMLFALCQLADGLVRTLSLGFLFSSMTLWASRRAAKQQLTKLKQRKQR